MFLLLVDVSFLLYLFIFFFKQKTAYEMRISDWSSDVCSSDLLQPRHRDAAGIRRLARREHDLCILEDMHAVEVGRHVGAFADRDEIGRASCRERVCQYV